MAWIAADDDESIYIFPAEPTRSKDDTIWTTYRLGEWYQIPKSVCEWLIGKVLTWEDEPVEIEIKIKNK